MLACQLVCLSTHVEILKWVDSNHVVASVCHRFFIDLSTFYTVITCRVIYRCLSVVVALRSWHAWSLGHMCWRTLNVVYTEQIALFCISRSWQNEQRIFSILISFDLLRIPVVSVKFQQIIYFGVFCWLQTFSVFLIKYYMGTRFSCSVYLRTFRKTETSINELNRSKHLKS